MYSPPMHKDATPYESNCSYSVIAAYQAFHAYAAKVGVPFEELKIKGHVLDLSCGPGAVTRIFHQLLDESAILDACDISQVVVDAATENNKQIKANFFVMDVTKAIPEKMKGSYDFVLNNFLLHWINDYRPVLKNIASMLKDKGQCLICFFANNPLYISYRELSKTIEWGPYMQDIENILTPFIDDKHADVTFKNIMIESGFKTAEVALVEIDHSYVRKKFTYDNYKSLLLNIDPFIEKIPNEDRQRYFDNLMDSYNKNKGFTTVYDPKSYNGEPLETTGKLIIAIGSK